MIQPNKLKKRYYYFLLLIFIIILAGCKSFQNNDKDAYKIYESDFLYLRDNFSSPNFDMSEELLKEFYSTTLPENSFFNEEDDLYDSNPLKPKNRRLLYINKEKNIAISLGYLFSENNLKKSFVTIDSVPVELINKCLTDKTLPISPYLDQFIMTNKHSIILLKVIYIGNSNITDLERLDYTNCVNDFFTDFTDCLSNQNK